MPPPDPVRGGLAQLPAHPHQRGTLKALGLTKPGSKVEREDSPQLRGQIRVVSHMVEVEES